MVTKGLRLAVGTVMVQVEPVAAKVPLPPLSNRDEVTLAGSAGKLRVSPCHWVTKTNTLLPLRVDTHESPGR